MRGRDPAMPGQTQLPALGLPQTAHVSVDRVKRQHRRHERRQGIDQGLAVVQDFFSCLRKNERKDLTTILYEDSQAKRLQGAKGWDREELARLRQEVARHLLLAPYIERKDRERKDVIRDALAVCARLHHLPSLSETERSGGPGD